MSTSLVEKIGERCLPGVMQDAKVISRWQELRRLEIPVPMLELPFVPGVPPSRHSKPCRRRVGLDPYQLEPCAVFIQPRSQSRCPFRVCKFCDERRNGNDRLVQPHIVLDERHQRRVLEGPDRMPVD